MTEGYFTMAIPARHAEFRSRRGRSRSRALLVTIAAMGGLVAAAVPGMAAATSSHASGAGVASAPAVVAYAYGNKPSAGSYTPEKGFSFNSTGEGIRISRANTGTYTVHFFGLGAFAGQGTVDVTAEGLQPSQCEVVHWLPDSTGTILLVRVNCFTVSGAKLDTPFMVAYTSGGSTTGTTDFVWADKPAASNYTPSLPFQFNSAGGTNRITRLGTGQYQVKLPGPVVADGSVKVTAYGNNANSCQVVEWLDSAPGQNVFVDCFTPAGALVNNRFTMTFTASDSFLGDGASHSGYLWGNDPTSATYTPDGAYQFDTAGTSATVTKLPPNPGEWETLYPNEADGAQGDQQATAYGSTPAHCIVDGPIGNGTSEQGDVFCFDTSGNLLDTLYTTQWVVG
jgi:hypothetical protein